MPATSSGKPTALRIGVIVGASALGGWVLVMFAMWLGTRPLPAHVTKRPVGPLAVMNDTTWTSGKKPERSRPATDGAITLQWPVHGTELSSAFGPRVNPVTGEGQEHHGVDIPLPCGSEVVAAEDGTVISSEWSDTSGYTISIAHEGGWVTRYAHLAERRVRTGQRVAAAEILGASGDTGSLSTGPHLHFEVLHERTPVDPMAFNYRQLAGPSNLTAVDCGPMRAPGATAVGSID
jgi:murein DD-endopeptidase MepM/ murein hydrolase activator NlpD